MTNKVLIVGAGLTGCVIARELAEKGIKAEIWERRDHVGGNMYDHYEEHGFLVHDYGPHAFHTRDRRLYDYIKRFGTWVPYKLKCGAVWDEKYTPTPFNYRTIDTFFDNDTALRLKNRFDKVFADVPGKEITVLDALNHEDSDVRFFAQYLFENDYAPYTAKQWGIQPEKVDPEVLKRVPLRFSYDEGYFNDEFQVIPESSYSEFFKNILEHKNITVKTGIDALKRICITDGQLLIDGNPADCPVVYTGAADELFGRVYGKLPYRSLRFEWHFDSCESYQEAACVAYPKEKGYTRITEYKKLPVQEHSGTVYAVEYPVMYDKGTGTEPYYPVRTAESEELFNKYEKLAGEIKGLFLAGRLADFKYYNMDQALARALTVSQEVYSTCCGSADGKESLYILIPAYNEEENIAGVIREWYPLLNGKSESSRLMINLSGCTDGTAKVVKECMKEFPKIRILDRSENTYGAKVIDLYDYAVINNADYIFQTDSDGQTYAGDFQAFWDKRKKYSAIIGKRTERGDGAIRALVMKVECLMIRLFFEKKVPDANVPFRLIDRVTLKKYMKLIPRDYEMPNIMLTALMAKYDENITFLPVLFKAREKGHQSMNIKKIVRTGARSLGFFRKAAEKNERDNKK